MNTTNHSKGTHLSYDGKTVTFFSYTGEKRIVEKQTVWITTQGRNNPIMVEPYKPVLSIKTVIKGVESNGYNTNSIHAILVDDEKAVDLFLSEVILPSHLQKAKELALQSTKGFSKSKSSTMIVLEEVPILNLGLFRIVILPKKTLSSTGTIAVDKDWRPIPHQTQTDE